MIKILKTQKQLNNLHTFYEQPIQKLNERHLKALQLVFNIKHLNEAIKWKSVSSGTLFHSFTTHSPKKNTWLYFSAVLPSDWCHAVWCICADVLVVMD